MGARCPGTGDKDPVEHQGTVAMGKCRTESCSALNHYGCAHQPAFIISLHSKICGTALNWPRLSHACLLIVPLGG